MTAKEKASEVLTHPEAQIEEPQARGNFMNNASTAFSHGNALQNDSMRGIGSFETLTFEDRSVRTLVRMGEPWFAGADICRVLGILNVTQAVRQLDADERMTLHLVKGHCAGQRGGARSLTYINEPGVYRLTMRSDKPKAKAFTRWLVHEVLPAIRKTGHYMTPAAKDTERAAGIWDTTIGTDGVHVLSELVAKKVKNLPRGLQHSAKMTLWRRLHTRYNVPRAELIPADQMDSAANFLAAYVYEGTVEEKQAPAMKPVVWTKPHQYGQPKDRGMPRTERAMKMVLHELMKWGSDNLPDGEVARSFHGAIRDVMDLQVTCWTEIDEALQRISYAGSLLGDAKDMLNRWQDRGGRIGNVGP